MIRGEYFLGDTGGEGIILGENSAGHCFVLRDLIPINFVSKNYQKYLISNCMICNQERDGVKHDACCIIQTSLDACSYNTLAMP